MINILGYLQDLILQLPDDRENVKLLVAKCSFSSVYTSYIYDYIFKSSSLNESFWLKTASVSKGGSKMDSPLKTRVVRTL